MHQLLSAQKLLMKLAVAFIARVAGLGKNRQGREV